MQLNKRDYLELAGMLGIAGLTHRTRTIDIFDLTRRELANIHAALAVVFPAESPLDQGMSTLACQRRIRKLYEAADAKGVGAVERIEALTRQGKHRI